MPASKLVAKTGKRKSLATGQAKRNCKAGHTANRAEIEKLTDLKNIGPSIAGDIQLIGIATPQELIGKDPLKLYEKLLELTGSFHDPCVLDCFISAVDFMNGGEPKVWWHFTAERKTKYGSSVTQLRSFYSE